MRVKWKVILQLQITELELAELTSQGKWKFAENSLKNLLPIGAFRQKTSDASDKF